MTENRKIQLMNQFKELLEDPFAPLEEDVLEPDIFRDCDGRVTIRRLERQFAMMVGFWIAMQPTLRRQCRDAIPFFEVFQFEIEQLAAVIAERSAELAATEVRR